MFNLEITAKTAIQFYLTAKKLDGISPDFLMCVWECTHKNDTLIIEFTKLKKQHFSDMLGIKDAMLKRYIKRLVDSGFLMPVDGFRAVYKYIENADIDYIMNNRYDLDNFIFSVSTKKDFELSEKDISDSPIEDISDCEKTGTLHYSKETERYQLISEDGKHICDFSCGTGLEIKYNGKWYITRFESNNDGYYLVKPDKLKRWPKKLNGLPARI